MLTDQADGRQLLDVLLPFQWKGYIYELRGGAAFCPFSSCAVPHRLDSFHYDSRDAVGRA